MTLQTYLKPYYIILYSEQYMKFSINRIHLACWVHIDSFKEGHKSVFCDAKMASKWAIYFGKAYKE